MLYDSDTGIYLSEIMTGRKFEILRLFAKLQR